MKKHLPFLPALVTVLISTAGIGNAQWTVTNLHPEGAEESAAFATDGARQAGVAVFDGVRAASLWSGSADRFSNLAPQGATLSEAVGISSDDQAGSVVVSDGPSRASLWQGTSESWVDLNPADVSQSWASASDNGRQVGWIIADGVDQASLWAGDKTPRVSLHPAAATASRAYDISGSDQVGWVETGGSQVASLWSDTALSWVNLNPVASTLSAAFGVYGVQQVGYATIDGVRNASLWTGSAASWVNLHPVGAASSEAFAVFEGWQVGQVVIDGVGRAAIWSGTAQSFENLADVLPAPETWGETNAEGLWITGDTISVVGYGFNTVTNRNEALLWSRSASIPAPTILPAGGVSNQGFQVAITSTVGDATIRYSLDGSDVTSASASYTSPLAIASDTAVQARAFASDRGPSAASHAYFSIGDTQRGDPIPTVLQPTAFVNNFMILAAGTADVPVIAPAAGSFSGTIDVGITTVGVADVIRFTLNGAAVTQSSPQYTGPISISQTTTVRARNFSDPADPQNPSAPSVAIFTITPAGAAAEAPTFEPDSGQTFLEPISIFISSPTPGSTLRYTTNGSAPTGNSQVYVGPIPITSSTTIRAQAFAVGLDPSPIASATYSLARQVPLPTILPAGGDVSGVVLVSIQIDEVVRFENGVPASTSPLVTPVTYRYTVDGSDVTPSSPLYVASEPIAIDQTTTLNVRGYVEFYVPSELATATFFVTPAGIAASAPVITPETEFIASTTQVGISSDVAGAQIRYTTNGDTVTAVSAVFNPNSPLLFSENTTLKARVYAQGLDPSPETTKSFIVDADTVATPVITPDSGEFEGSVLVEIATATQGATIRFTLDGTPPDETSQIYTGPISLPFESLDLVNPPVTVSARAFAPDRSPSELAQATFNVVPSFGTAFPPVVTPAAGTYSGVVTVEIESANPNENGIIRYSIIGPVSGTSPIYDGPLSLTASAVLQAVEFVDGKNPSRIETNIYTINPASADAVITVSPDEGIYAGSVLVSLSSTTPGVLIRYTTDESDVSSTSPIYDGPLSFVPEGADPTTITLKAVAFAAGFNPSAQLSKIYEVNPANTAFTVANPVVTPNGGSHQAGTRVTLTLPRELEPLNPTIRYTLDGTKVVDNSPIFDPNDPIALGLEDDGIIISARAFIDGYNPSRTIKSAVFTITPNQTDAPTVAPQILPNGGIFRGSVPVILDGGGTIRYTTDGSPVTQFSTLYDPASGPIWIVSSTTLNARGFSSLNPSATVTAIFEIIPAQETAATPVADPAGGNYSQSISVEMTSTTPGSVIKYTINGDEVTGFSPQYSGPIEISETSTIRARAYANGLNPSETTTETYFIAPRALPTPIVRPNGGTFAGVVPVEMDTIPVFRVTQDLYYTLNGDDVTVASILYEGPILVTENTVLKVRSFVVEQTGEVNYGPSETVEVNFVITPAAETAPAPVITPNGGPILSTTQIALTSTRDDVQIRYTTDNSPVTGQSLLYNDSVPITLTDGATIKARAYVPGLNPSAETQATFTVDQTTPAPVILPVGGTFEGTVNVEITNESFDVVIRYTLNGQPVTPLSPIYTGPISLPENPLSVSIAPIVVTAQAFAPGSLASDPVQESFVITPSSGTAFAPEITPASGNYQGSVLVNIASDMPGAIIRYTTDGSPVAGGSLIYSGPLSVVANTVIKAAVFVEGLNASAEAAATYSVAAASQTTATPTITPEGGAYTGSVLVSIASATPGATVRYTLDGTTVTKDSAIYTEPFSVFSGGGLLDVQVQAQAFADGFNPSAISAGAYTLTPAAANLTAKRPVITSDGGVNQGGTRITLSAPAPQVPTTEPIVIRYTLDGSPVTGSSLIYRNDAPIFVNEALTVKARSFIDGYNPSGTAEASFSVSPNQAETPIIIPSGGIFFGSVPVQFAPNAGTIRYTTDGSRVTQFSTAYDVANGALWLFEDTVLKARAFSELNASATVEAVFQVEAVAQAAEAPVMDPVGGNYAGSVSVEMTSTTPGSVIKYTINGGEVTGFSPQYSGPIEIFETSTIRARTYANGFNPSETTTETYFIGPRALPTPIVRPNGGTFAGVVQVEMVATPVLLVLQALYYTLNGDDVTVASILYEGPIMVTENTVLKVRSFVVQQAGEVDYGPSETVEVNFVITPAAETAPAPTITPGGGVISSTQSISLTSSRADAQIRYTLDGTPVTSQSPLYRSTPPLTLEGDATVSARAFVPGLNPSATAVAAFQVIETVAKPVFLPGGSSFYGGVTVSMTSTTPGAAIHYTTNGSAPTLGSSLYTSPIRLSATTTLNAATFLSGLPPSAVTTVTYTITPAIVSPAPGNSGFVPSPTAPSNAAPGVEVSTLQQQISALQTRVIDVRRRVKNPTARAAQIRRLNMQIMRLRVLESQQ